MIEPTYLIIDDEPLIWQSEHQAKLPKQYIKVDDTLTANKALQFARSGCAMVWQGDFINAKQLLSAMARKIDRKKSKVAPDIQTQFHLYRLAQAQKAQLLGMLLIRVEKDFLIQLRRAPDIKAAAEQVWSWQAPFIVSLRELLGVIGAYEWRKKGVSVPVLGAKIYPFYGVFSPIRGEYIDLVANAPLPEKRDLAIEIGVGTGVLSAVLARRGYTTVLATDTSDRSVACATYNIKQLGIDKQVQIMNQAFFPDQKADLILCNPPWLPSKASTTLESAVYDPQSMMLKGFLAGLADHLNPQGQGWLILSDLAEHLSLRTREELLTWITLAGLKVVAKYDTQPKHKKVMNDTSPLAMARQQETTSLWVLEAVSDL
ncbi:class I SAM-dependent methyltransferase [Pelistega sp. NLN82]|uniref:Class I SAM-dependent methyltransferase n=1 Tax=Pelistega ratti TaxID=2652177 RepID=A0A6L9Y985_9BURK|nr:class I SAM-dependent methyltransferase [Pelistega ratti]NEN76348.1 class I SAM-dependent methyltransferase [Pelistega ratti]